MAQRIARLRIAGDMIACIPDMHDVCCPVRPHALHPRARRWQAYAHALLLDAVS